MFCQSSFLSGIVSEPFSYARKVFTQLGYFFFPDDGTFFRTRIKMGKLYEYVLTTIPESLDATISQPVREMFDTYRRSAVLQAAQLAEQARHEGPFLLTEVEDEPVT